MSIYEADVRFFELCSPEERAFYENWQRKSGFSAARLCEILKECFAEAAEAEAAEQREWAEQAAAEANRQRLLIQGSLGQQLTELMKYSLADRLTVDEQLAHREIPLTTVQVSMLQFVKSHDQFEDTLEHLRMIAFVRCEKGWLTKISEYAAAFFDLFVEHYRETLDAY